jgi:hypothetical protein
MFSYNVDERNKAIIKNSGKALLSAAIATPASQHLDMRRAINDPFPFSDSKSVFPIQRQKTERLDVLRSKPTSDKKRSRPSRAIGER